MRLMVRQGEDWVAGEQLLEEALMVVVDSKLNKSQLCGLAGKWPTRSVWTEVQPGD